MKTKGFSHTLWDPSQNGQQRNSLLTAIFLPSETNVIKIEAHAKRTEPDYQGNPSLADYLAKAAALESIKTVAHVNRVHLLLQRMASRRQTFSILISL